MQTIVLYRYERDSGGVTVSPVKPDVEHSELYRLIADEGKVLTMDGDNLFPCVDVESVAGWREVDDPYFELTEFDRYGVAYSE